MTPFFEPSGLVFFLAVNIWRAEIKYPLRPIGTRGESRGATQVKRVALTKISLCDATGKGSQRHSFRYAAGLRLYPCPITGAPELGYLCINVVQHVYPLNSKVHSTSALLPRFQNFCPALWKSLLSVLVLVSVFIFVGRYSMPEAGMCQEVNDPDSTDAQFSKKWHIPRSHFTAIGGCGVEGIRRAYLMP